MKDDTKKSEIDNLVKEQMKKEIEDGKIKI